jgi:hypothetical protein
MFEEFCLDFDSKSALSSVDSLQELAYGRVCPNITEKRMSGNSKPSAHYLEFFTFLSFPGRGPDVRTKKRNPRTKNERVIYGF